MGETFEMDLSADHHFVSMCTMRESSVTYKGTWEVQEGVWFAKITNCIPLGTTNFQTVGSVDKFTIIHVDQTDLVYTNETQTISLKRKRRYLTP